MIYLHRFCCKLRISGDYDEEIPGGEFLGVVDMDIEAVREAFADLRVSPLSDWYEEDAALKAWARAQLHGRTDALHRRLVDTEAAMLYTGRPRSTLYRWSEEGRITRYTDGPAGLDGGRRIWDVLELPARGPLGPGVAPPRGMVRSGAQSVRAAAPPRAPRSAP